MERKHMKIISLLLCSGMIAGSLNGIAPVAFTEAMEGDFNTYSESWETPLTEGGWEEGIPGETLFTDWEEYAPTESIPLDSENCPVEDFPSFEENQPEESFPSEAETLPGEEENLNSFPWLGMEDEEFSQFIQSREYLIYSGDYTSMESIKARLEMVQDGQLRELLREIITPPAPTEGTDIETTPTEAPTEEPTTEPTEAPTEEATQPTIDLNGDEMFFEQSVRGTCTLTANAMLVRRAARLSGNPDWASVTEQALRGTAWLEGRGMVWNYTFAGISVGHTDLSSPSEETIISMLQAHPEGFVAYNSNVPHAVLITDCTDGVLYCSDPGYDASRKPLTSSLLGKGSQAASVAGITALWYVTSPGFGGNAVVETVKPVTLSLNANPDGSITLNWNNTDAAGYWVYRSTNANGPWEKAVATMTGADQTSWSDAPDGFLTTYYYCVQSYDKDWNGKSRSNVVSFTPDRGGNHIADGTTGNLRWTVYDDGMMLITGDGAMPDYGDGSAPWSICSGAIREVYLSSGITSVGSYAFAGCSQLGSISLPGSVTSIGGWAFQDCSALRSVSLGGVRTIGYSAFRQCYSLTGITIPSSVSSIGDWAFSNCPNLTTVNFSEGLVSIGSSAFYEDAALTSASLPSTLQTIGDHAFRGCTALGSIFIPASVESVGSYAFAMCRSASSVSFGRVSGSIRLGEFSFYNCTGISSLVLPACQVGTQAFAYCTGLRNVTINQSGATSVLGDSVFYKCSKLTVVLANGGSVSYSAGTLSGCNAQIMSNSSLLDGLKDFVAAGLCSDTAFWYLDQTGTLHISGTGAIRDCSAGSAPWSDYSASVTGLIVDAGISSIGANAFYGCRSLGNIYLLQETAPAFSSSTFLTVTANVHFHAANASWNSVTGNNFGGKLTWMDEHNYSWKVKTAPTKTQEGLVIGTCILCKGEETLNLPKLDKENYIYTERDGKGIYTWKETKYGSLEFEVSTTEITKQPVSITVDEEKEASFTISALGAGLKYQWQTRSASTPWANIPNSNSATLTVTAVPAKHGFQYRCVITDQTGLSVISDAATLSVNAVLRIVTQPVDKAAVENATALFSVTASGIGLKYQWQWQAPDGAWENCPAKITGSNSAILRPMALKERDGYQFRCIVTDEKGEMVSSTAAKLTIKPATVILHHPADCQVKEKETAVFSTEAVGANLSYVWQWKSFTSDWEVCRELAGWNSTTLSFEATAALNGYQFRCIISDPDNDFVITGSAVLTVEVAESTLAITGQPQLQIIPAGSAAAFRVTAKGYGLTYQWQWKAPVRGWVNCTSATKGFDTATLEPNATPERNGYLYRCIVTDSTGKSEVSGAAVLYLASDVTIANQPTDQSVPLYQEVQFAVAAEEDALTYRWQWKTTDLDWTDCTAATTGFDSPTIHPITNQAHNGFQYRCLILDAMGYAAVTNEVTLTVQS